MAKKKATSALLPTAAYSGLLGEVVSLLENARRTSARAVNAVMTATYWEIGRRIVEVEQRGEQRAGYGDELIQRLATDLTARFGRGFSPVNLRQMRRFFGLWPEVPIQQTPSAESGVEPEKHNRQTLSVKTASHVTAPFPLPWSHYVKLLSVDDAKARKFYEAEALRGGWSVRQLDRQISTLFYQRTLLSKNKTAMLRKGAEPQANDLVMPEQEIKDPFVLEFLDLKDEYSEHELEEALILKLEEFLLELGGDFTFIGRQRRLRVGDVWYRIDLLFYHRRLRCLVVIDLKIGDLTHADTGQMHLYLNYVKEHWTYKDENPPVGLILCAKKDEAVAHYALDGLPNKVMAAEYRMALPEEKVLIAELEKTQRALELKTIRSDTSPREPILSRTKKKAKSPRKRN